MPGVFVILVNVSSREPQCFMAGGLHVRDTQTVLVGKIRNKNSHERLSSKTKLRSDPEKCFCRYGICKEEPWECHEAPDCLKMVKCNRLECACSGNFNETLFTSIFKFISKVGPILVQCNY